MISLMNPNCLGKTFPYIGLNYGAFYCVPNLGIYNGQIRIYALIGL